MILIFLLDLCNNLFNLFLFVLFLLLDLQFQTHNISFVLYIFYCILIFNQLSFSLQIFYHFIQIIYLQFVYFLLISINQSTLSSIHSFTVNLSVPWRVITIIQSRRSIGKWFDNNRRLVMFRLILIFHL